MSDEQARSNDAEIEPERQSQRARPNGLWLSALFGLLVLLVLIIFILENDQKVKVSFFGAHGHLGLGIALFLAAVIGALVVLSAESARIIRRRGKSNPKRPRRARSSKKPNL